MVYSVSDSVNRGMSTARRMQVSLYDWIVYQRRYKARERKGEREDGWCGRLVQIYDEGRQGASGKRANTVILSRDYRSTEFHRNSPPSSTKCRNMVAALGQILKFQMRWLRKG